MQRLKTLVRPYFKYYLQFCSSHYRKDVSALEWVKKRFTRMLPGLDSIRYKQRLDKLVIVFPGASEGEGGPDGRMKGTNAVDSQSLFPRKKM